MGVYTIFKTDGNVLIKGSARSPSSLLRHFIEKERVTRRTMQSPAKIDLRGLDASRFVLDLHGVDLSDVDLTGAKIFKGNLMGALCKGAVLDDVTFNQCSLQGLRMSRTSARNLRMQKCLGGGAEFVKVNLEESVFEENEFDRQTKFTQCEFPFFISRKNNYDGVTFTDPQFQEGSFVGDSLKGATFTVLTPKLDTSFMDPLRRLNGGIERTASVLSEDTETDIVTHLENRMNGARFFNCKYDNTKIAPCYRSILWDKWLGYPASLVGYVTAIASIDWALDKASEKLTEAVVSTSPAIIHSYPHIIGSGIIAFSLAAVLHEKMADKGHEYVRTAFNAVWNGVKYTALKARKAGHDLAECVALVGNERKMRAIYDTLKATGEDSSDKGVLRMIGTVAGGIVTGKMDSIITCTRKNFARALSCLSDKGVMQDTSILLCPDLTGPSHNTAPCALTLHADGSGEAIWYYEDDHRIRAKIAYDVNGKIDKTKSFGNGTSDPISDQLATELDAVSMKRVISQVRRAIVFHPDLENACFTYNPRTHYISEGRDNAILVRSLRTRKIDNPDGPAIVKIDNSIRLATQDVSHLPYDETGKKIISKAKETRKKQASFCASP